MNQFGLFDPPMHKGAGETGRPVDAGDAHHPVRASSDHAVDAERASSGSATDGVRRACGGQIPLSPDVLRAVQHKTGRFIEVREGGPTGRKFRFVELQDHSIWYVFDDGSRVPAPALIVLQIEDGIQNGMYVEVTA